MSINTDLHNRTERCKLFLKGLRETAVRTSNQRTAMSVQAVLDIIEELHKRIIELEDKETK